MSSSLAYITEDQVTAAISYQDAIDSVKEAHLALEKGEAFDNPRSRVRTDKLSLHSMSAASTELGLAAAKVYTGSTNGVHALVILFSEITGKQVAIIEANHLGRLRTTATSAVAASALAPNAKSLAIIGSGYQAEGVALAFLADSLPFSIEQTKIYSRSEEKRERLAAKLNESITSKFSGAASAKEALEKADVAVTITSSSKPVITTDDLSPSLKCICAAGANTLARSELHPRVVTAANRVIVDSIETAKREAGDLLHPLENGKLHWKQVVELGTVLESPNIIASNNSFSIFCSQGLAVQDLYLASKVLERTT